jgi:hypothetical protein
MVGNHLYVDAAEAAKEATMVKLLVPLAFAVTVTLAASGVVAQECCGDCSGDGSVTVDEILTAVGFALDGCPIVTPVATVTATASVTTGVEPTSTPTSKPGPTEPPGERFVDNGDGSITDMQTGLMWEKKSDDGSVHDWDNAYSWSVTGAESDGTVFTVFVSTLNDQAFAGHSDWRVPTLQELGGIADYDVVDPAAALIFDDNCELGCEITECSCTKSSFYWSSTDVANDANSAWFADFSDGALDQKIKIGNARVRGVRGGL